MLYQEQEQDNDQMVEQFNKQDDEGAVGRGSAAWSETHQEQEQRSMMDGEAWSETRQEQERKRIIIVCKDERDWIDPETGMPYAGFDMCEISMITTQNILKFQNSVIVLDDMGNKFNIHIKYYFTEGRHKSIQMIVMCHKPAQIDNLARMNCDINYITTWARSISKR